MIIIIIIFSFWETEMERERLILHVLGSLFKCPPWPQGWARTEAQAGGGVAGVLSRVLGTCPGLAVCRSTPALPDVFCVREATACFILKCCLSWDEPSWYDQSWLLENPWLGSQSPHGCPTSLWCNGFTWEWGSFGTELCHPASLLLVPDRKSELILLKSIESFKNNPPLKSFPGDRINDPAVDEGLWRKEGGLQTHTATCHRDGTATAHTESLLPRSQQAQTDSRETAQGNNRKTTVWPVFCCQHTRVFKETFRKNAINSMSLCWFPAFFFFFHK